MRIQTSIVARWAAGAALLLGLAAPAQAHDTWVMPPAFRLPAGQPVTTLLSAGHGLAALSPVRRRRLRALQLIDSAGRSEPQGWRPGAKASQADFAAPAPGVACLALTPTETGIEIDPDTVDHYLAEVAAPAAVLEAWPLTARPLRARCTPAAACRPRACCLTGCSSRGDWPS